MDVKMILLGLCVMAARIDSGLSLSVSSVAHDLVVAAGDEVTLPCVVTGEGYSNWFNTITWYKVLDDGGEEMQMTQQAMALPPYKETGRYTITPDQKPDSIDFSLRITDVTAADQGTFLCKLEGEKVEDPVTVTHSIVVPLAIDSLEMTTNNSRTDTSGNETKVHFEFEELSPAYVSCVSKGGNPQPQLRMMRGRVDVTDEFQMDVKSPRTGPRGLDEVHYEVSLVRADFRATSDYSGHNLKCLAKVPRSGRGKADKQIHHKEVRTATMDVRYKPVFDCERDHVVEPGTPVYLIQCNVHAHPKVDVSSIHWTVQGENGSDGESAGNATVTSPRVITAGQSDVDGLSTNISVDAATSHVQVTLMIEDVNVTHYQQQFVLKARNALGQHQFEARLRQATTTVPTTTSRPKYNVVDGSSGKQDGLKLGESNGGKNQNYNVLISLATLLLAVGFLH